MISLASGALPMILSLVTWLLNRANASAETKKAYREFMNAIEDDAGNSAKLRTSAQSQKEKIFAQLDAEEKANAKTD